MQDDAERDTDAESRVLEILAVAPCVPEELRVLAASTSFDVGDSYSRYFDIGISLAEALNRIDVNGDDLLRLALDGDAPWYVRRHCVNCLRDRARTDLVAPRAAVVSDETQPSELRAATLNALVAGRIPGPWS